jgi:outer membrane protein TolC
MFKTLHSTDFIPWLALLLVAAGCAAFDASQTRQDQSRAFNETLEFQARELLGRPLSLGDCIRIAMTNNYAARQADLDMALLRVAKNVAFTAFLPNVSVSAGYNSHQKTPNPMSEKRFGQASLDASVPLFLPSAWFVYAATRHGYRAAELAANHVRQGIVLETSQAYYQVLVLQETVVALETQYRAARENADRIEGLAREGFFTAWERDQARLLAEMRQTEWNTARRRLGVARSDLLVTLGLSPLIIPDSGMRLRLSGDTGEPWRPEGTTAELVLSALEVHPMLSIADRRVVIQEHAVRRAFTAFLPVLNLTAAGAWTGNDLAEHAANWMTAFNGTWQLFSGLANVARYKAARVERRQSELERESTLLNIMAQVIAAEAAVRDAVESARLNERAYAVASAKFADYDAKSREGLLPLSEALDARAAMDLAQVALVKSRYQERIALASLELAMGLTLVPVPDTGPSDEAPPPQ